MDGQDPLETGMPELPPDDGFYDSDVTVLDLHLESWMWNSPGDSIEDVLHRSGIQTGSPSRRGGIVLVVLVPRDSCDIYIHYYLMVSLDRFISRETTLESGRPIIPIFIDVECCPMTDFLHPMSWEPGLQDFRRRLETTTGHDLARYNGDEDKLKFEVLISVFKAVRGLDQPLLEEAIEVMSQAQIYNMRVSTLEKEVRQVRPMVIKHLKLLARELTKHAMDKVSLHPSRTGRSSRVWNKRKCNEVREVAKRLSFSPEDFAKMADHCIDARNNVAHFQTCTDWRKTCADAVQFINRDPDLTTRFPDGPV